MSINIIKVESGSENFLNNEIQTSPEVLSGPFNKECKQEIERFIKI